MKSKVSIVIPVFNSGQYLPDTIKSIEKQSFENWEVIIVDNGSTEKSTCDYLDLIRTNYTDKFHVFTSEEPNVSAARNLGIDKAQGEYILLLDSDDLIHPDFLKKCINEFDLFPETTLVRTQVKLFGKKSGILKFEPYSYSLLLARNLMVVTSLFKKQDAVSVGGFDKAFKDAFEDWEFWIRLLKNNGIVKTVEEPLFNYRIRKGSRNHSLRMNHLKIARKLIWEKHKAQYANYFVDPMETFEYKLLEDSKAYKIGNLLLKPFSSFKLMK